MMCCVDCLSAVMIIVVLSPWCDDDLFRFYRADRSGPLAVASTRMVGLMVAMQSCGAGLGCDHWPVIMANLIRPL